MHKTTYVNQTHKLTIGHCNIQGGLTSLGKTRELKRMINKYDIDILSLNETNLNDSIDSCTLNLPSCFDFLRKDRGKGSRGGCGMLVSKNCAYTEIDMPTSMQNIEAIWIKVKTHNLYVCGFYRSNNYCSVENFIDYMNDCMKKLSNKKVLWIGDINIDQNNISLPQYKKLDMALKSYNMVQTVQEITRVAKFGDRYTSTSIDVVFTNCYSDFDNTNVLPERIGDHQAILCQLCYKVNKHAKYEKLVIRDHSQNNITLFKEYLAYEYDYSHILQCTDVESAANEFNEFICNNYEQFCQLKSITIHDHFIHRPSSELLNAIKLKKVKYRSFRKALRMQKDNIPFCNNCKACELCRKLDQKWNRYKKQRNLVKKLAKKCKKDNIIKDLKAKSAVNDLKGIWKTIKMASNIRPSNNNVDDSNNSSLDPDKLNTHFSTIGEKIQADVPNHGAETYRDFLPDRGNLCSFSSFKEVTSSEIEGYIKALPPGKAVYDKVPLKIFKSILPNILEPLTHIVNLSLNSGIVPKFCKYAQVTPIHKGGSKDDEGNYRPISILPILGKIIEYFVNEQLSDYLESNELFTEHQYGFRKHHSTTYLMLDLMDEIIGSKAKSGSPAIVFLDIRKAFDAVNHRILIEKLLYYGIQGIVLDWIKSFLSERQQCTRFKKGCSSFREVTCGVPQGSILGPLLFSIFINDMVNACHHSKPFLFADDGALYFDNICRMTYIQIRFELIYIRKWLDLNKLSLNVQKTNFLVFDNCEYLDRVYLGKDQESGHIDECRVVKYLGLMVDNKLSFGDHIDYIKKKISKRIGAMYRCKSLLPLKYRKMFANALMLPIFDYLDTIYSKSCRSGLNDLDILYKKVAKIALDVSTRESSLVVYREMGWLPLHLRRQAHLSAYMYRILNGSCPSLFKQKFEYISGSSRGASNGNLYIPQSNNLKDFTYIGAKYWNVVPQDLRDYSDVKMFSKVYKKRLLASIQENPNYSVDNLFSNAYKIPNVENG